MERESFEDEEVARLLNERFVAIKVDREERPDVDSIYMTVCQMMTGQGGWPLHAFLTPDQVPFYAGTYFPKESRYGLPSFKEVIVQLFDQYKNSPEKITNVGSQISNALQGKSRGKSALQVEEIINQAFQTFRSSFDERFGGFGQAPKFPTPHILTFLLRYYKFFQKDQALDMVVHTLDAMGKGGIYDQIGFGFSRYSVDDRYLVPHFEKMLYDNALLATAFTEAYQITKENRFKKKVDEIFEYVLRDMRHDRGGFYCAEDADSEGVEGKFYVWTPEEVKSILGDALGSLYCDVYDITEPGNFEGENIPNLIDTDLHEFAKRTNEQVEHLEEILEQARIQLFNQREERVHPHKDDKILTSWNGLMIVAFAKAGAAFNNKKYIQAATEAMEFIEKDLIIDGRVMLRYRDNEVKQLGFLDDYAFLLWAYIELYEATFDQSYLKKSVELEQEMERLFWDDTEGGFFFNASDHEQLLIRPKDSYDGAIPSGNSVAAVQMIRLARLTGNEELERKVEQLFAAFAADIALYPSNHTFMLQASLLKRSGMKEVAILSAEGAGNPLSRHLQHNFYPEVTVLCGTDGQLLGEVAPFARGYQVLNDQSTYYVCQHFVCQQPTNNIDEAIRYLFQ